MSSEELPPCGIYVTRDAIGQVPAGRFVYFHNHGNPGPGVYLPAKWRGNRARFSARGHTLTDPARAKELLEPLPAEGFYRVVEPFFCCEKQCTRFEPDRLVQLGYNGAGDAIVFSPEWVDSSLALPERGTRVERDRLVSLAPLRIKVSDTPLHEGEADEVFLH
jgi:hypothetical protein